MTKQLKFLTIALVVCLCAQAAWAAGGVRVSMADAQRMVEAAGHPATDSLISSFIWADKYVYNPGSTAVVKWTVRPNGDLFPYTVFMYRRNLQTGQKLYLPNLTAEVTDIYGRTAAQGFDIRVLSNQEKVAMTGPGGMFPNGGLLPQGEDVYGMHEFVLEIRDYTGTRIIKSAFVKLGIVRGRKTINADITANTTLTNDYAWDIEGIIFVTNNAELTVEPGTFIFGKISPKGFLTITRGAKGFFRGTKARPIIMSPDKPIGTRIRGDWGGLSIGGAAPTTRGTNADMELVIQDERAKYGGSNAADNSGVYTYLRLEFCGALIDEENEPNALTFYGIGSGTTIHHIETHYGQDDSFEFFGGLANVKYCKLDTGGDDGFDWTFGWSGNAQYIIDHHRGDNGERGMECDTDSQNFSATPQSEPRIYNFTLVGDGSAQSLNDDGMKLRNGTAGHLFNGIVLNWPGDAIDVDTDVSFNNIANGTLEVRNAILWNNKGGKTTLQEQIASDTWQAVQAWVPDLYAVDPMLRRPELTDGDYMPKVGSPAGNLGWVKTPPDNGFFDTVNVNCIGGMCRDNNWLDGWALNGIQEEEMQ